MIKYCYKIKLLVFKLTLYTLAILAASLIWVSSGFAQESAEQLYQSALYKEEIEGNLDKAIEIYESIVEDHPENRSIAAKALFRIGLCYEKLGNREAQKAYQRIIREFPDQREVAARARARLAALERPERIIYPKGIAIRQVWSDSLVDLDGSPSPDGKYFAYTDWHTGDLALRELSTGEFRRLTDKASLESNVYALWPVISPDNKLISYNWFHENGLCDLCVIGIDGSNPRVILAHNDTLNQETVAWSSDGKHIATIFRENKINTLAWVSVADGSSRRLKTLGKEWPGRVFHSPDDKYIGYSYPVEEGSENWDIYLLATDGSGENLLVKHPANDKLLGWVPGKDEILFLSNRTGTWDVWMIRVTDGRPRGLPELVKSALGQVRPIGITRNGLCFFGIEKLWYYSNIVSLDPETGKVTGELQHPFTGASHSPLWSPDGAYLAYVSVRTSPQDPNPAYYKSSLRIRSLETGEEREVPTELKGIELLRWSADSRYLLVAGYIKRIIVNMRDKLDLYRVDVQTGETTVLLQDSIKSFAYGDWTPDRQSIFYKNQDRIMVRQLETKQEKQLYQDPNLDRMWQILAVSPDGQTLAFGLKGPKSGWGARSIMTIPVAGGEVRELFSVEDSGMIQEIEWTPDGQRLLLRKFDRKGRKVSWWRITSKGGEPTLIWEPEINYYHLRFHPNGRQIAFHRNRWIAEVWVMENFLPTE